jgi:hypothetical protein
MRKVLWLLALVLSFSASAMAQDTPLIEAFGGYQYMRAGKGSNINLQGWNGSVAVNLNDWLGVVGDVSGVYATKPGISGTLALHTFTFGPQVTYRKEKRTAPFMHFLLGGTRANDIFSAMILLPARANTTFTMTLGGGMDVRINDRFSIRAGQLDWLQTKFRNSRQSNYRFSTGLVFRFGKK